MKLNLPCEKYLPEDAENDADYRVLTYGTLKTQISSIRDIFT